MPERLYPPWPGAVGARRIRQERGNAAHHRGPVAGCRRGIPVHAPLARGRLSRAQACGSVSGDRGRMGCGRGPGGHGRRLAGSRGHRAAGSRLVPGSGQLFPGRCRRHGYRRYLHGRRRGGTGRLRPRAHLVLRRPRRHNPEDEAQPSGTPQDNAPRTADLTRTQAPSATPAGPTQSAANSRTLRFRQGPHRATGSSRGAGKRTLGGGIPAWRLRFRSPARIWVFARPQSSSAPGGGSFTPPTAATRWSMRS